MVTRPGGRSAAALSLAAVLGISGGAITAFVARDDEPPPQDPLGLGVPLVDLDCTGEAIMIVGRGNKAADLRNSVVDFDGARYLEPAESCPTFYPLFEGEPARYAVYLADYPSIEAACEVRMSNDHKGDIVTVLDAEATDPVMCPCELDRAELPEIGGEGEDVTTESFMWTYMFQSMLADAGYLTSKQVNGEFDKTTFDATRVLQTDTLLPALGKVTTDTWVQLRDKACKTYQY